MNLFWSKSPQSQEEEEDDTYDHQAVIQAVETEAKRVWEPMKSWFFEQGYTLFVLGSLGHSIPLLDTPSELGTSPQYPYAFFGGDSPYYDPLEAYYSRKVCFAQDSQLRHVAIKKLSNHDEICIYRLLWEKREILAENCILPILEILEFNGHCFAVMPRKVMSSFICLYTEFFDRFRWGEDTCYPDYGSIGNVLHYIHCLLKDLKADNTLVNHFGAYRANAENFMRAKLLSKGLLTYALYDFDLSLMLPSNECRLPAGRSYEVTSVIWPYDTAQGELDYDPYKFEMGCLGILLCRMFQTCIPSAHFLAPFLDRLITHKVENRFTSEEALKYFEEMRLKLTFEQLSVKAPMYLESGYPPWEPGQYNRWEGLSEIFLKEWGHFKASTPSLYTTILRRLCTTVWGERCVMAIRRFFRLITVRMSRLSYGNVF